ncbi:BTB/POZ domain-containing protein [Ditylenchus destructor]|uniref:BTB/POZ domain-containing protein n=1 Tax=Ditylenchus destructor TaxID=166010 RepID=A0AAD4MYA4_9BILA|nr:BTB/POZ domain-containing protein [Ditylenchus destructor]
MTEKGTLELRIDQFSKQPAVTINIHGRVWEAKAQFITTNNLAFILQCNGRDFDSNWKCRAIANCHIVSQKEGVDDIISHKVHDFSQGDSVHFDAIRYDVLLDPDNGFIKNDTIIVRVHVTAKMPQGVENAKSIKFVSSISDPPDGVLIVGDKRIPIHKTYLPFYSDFFKTMFREDEIVLEEVGYEEMLELLSVIYPSNAPITEKNIKTILKLADRFIMPSVLERCKKELAIPSKTNGALKLLMAQRYNFTDLLIQLAQRYKTTEAIKNVEIGAGIQAIE